MKINNILLASLVVMPVTFLEESAEGKASKFIFNVTGYGAQFFTNNAGAPGNNPNGGGGRGRFSGYFEVKDALLQ